MSLTINPQHQTIATHLPKGLVIFKILFGGVFFVIGAMGVYSLLTGGDVTVNGRPGTPDDVWLPGIFAVLGFMIVTFTYHRRIDLALKTITTRWGFLLPLFGRTKPLSPITAISIDRETRRSDNSSYTVYVAKLRFDTNKPINIDENRDRQSTRRIAEDVAKMCHRPLHDNSNGQTVERQVADLDKRLVDAEPQPRIRPSLPQGLETKLDENGQTHITLPAPPLSNRLIKYFIPTLIVLGFWWFAWYDPDRFASSDTHFMFKAFNYAPLFMLIPMLSALRKLPSGGGSVYVNNGQLIVGRQSIPINELEELTVTHRGLVAHSDNTTLQFAHGCDRTQLEQLREYILYELHTKQV